MYTSSLAELFRSGERSGQVTSDIYMGNRCEQTFQYRLFDKSIYRAYDNPSSMEEEPFSTPLRARFSVHYHGSSS